MKHIAFALTALACPSFAFAGNQDVYITEFTYKGLFGEFIEITNTHATNSVDLTDWSFDDNSRIAGTVLFPSATLPAATSLIITEVSEAVFVQVWFTEPAKSRNGALILENNTTNIGNGDEINVYDDNSILVDRINFDDQRPGAGPSSDNCSVIPKGTALGSNDYTNTLDGNGWEWSASGGPGGTPLGNAWKAGVPGASGSIGSPGTYPN